MANIISNLTQMPNLSGITKSTPSISGVVSQAKSAIPMASNITQIPSLPSGGNILNIGKGLIGGGGVPSISGLIPGGAGGMLSSIPGIGSAMGNISLPGLGGGGLSNIGGMLSGGASNLFSGIQGQASSLLSGVTGQISGLASGITGQLSGIGSSLGGIFNGGGLSSLNGLTSGFGNIGSLTSGLGNIGGLSSLTSGLGNIGGLTSGLGSLGNIGSLTSGLGNIGGLTSGLGGIGSLASGLGGIGGIGNLAGGLGSMGNIAGNFGNLGSLAGGFSNIGGAGSLLNSGAGSLLSGGATSMLGGGGISSLTSMSDPMSLFDSMDFSQFAMGGFGASAVAAIYLKVLKSVSKKGKGMLETQAKRYKMKKPFNFMMENPDAEELTKMSNTLFDSLSQGGDAYSDDKEFDESDWGSEGEDDSTPAEEVEQPTGAETVTEENKMEEESLPTEEFKGEESTNSDEWSGESEIIKSEARVDKNGNLVTYRPPANDGGGAYEVAGFTEKYNKKEAQALMAAPPDQRRAMAEGFAAEKTKNANNWVTNGNKASKYVVQDTIFHRGDGGAAQMIKMSVGNPAYNSNGKLSTSAKLTSSDIAKFNSMTPQQQISSLTAARKTYEAKVVGVRPNLQKGLDNRFNNTQSTALKHV